MMTQYLQSNIMTLMVLFALVVFMIINRKNKIPAAHLFKIGAALLLLLTCKDIRYRQLTADSDFSVRILTVMDVASYILRPVIIMLELFIIVPAKKQYRLLCAAPAAVNAVIYSTALFGSRLAFYYASPDVWIRGPLGFTVYAVQMLYIALLFVCSALYFKRKNLGKSLIVLTIIIQAIAAAVLEYRNFTPSITNAVTALGMLEYYIYLTTIYQQEISDSLLLKKLEISEAETQILRSQIQPHFIYNTLTIIRSLVRTDRAKAIEAINSFSKYLRTHISTIQSEDLISFQDELKNVEIYIDLAQTDYPGKIEIVYDLAVTEFRIPPLSLEPIVENAIQHGISRRGGRITIRTVTEGEHIVICVSDDGTAKKELTPKAAERLGVGLKNTEKRLELQCGGTMETAVTENGCVVTVRIPNRREQHENTDRR